MFRCDSLKDDPAQIKYNLSEFGNRTLVDLWLTKGCPTNIKIVKPALECKGEVVVSSSAVNSPQARRHCL